MEKIVTGLNEIVDLPDPDTQPLVHPLDLPQARQPFLASWWLSLLAGPPIVFALAALLWVVSNNYVTPVLVPLGTGIAAAFASAFAAREAWAYIPRRRQDTDRRLPGRWSVLGTVLPSAGLLVGLLLVVFWMRTHEVSGPVAAYTIGSGAMIAVLMLLTVITRLIAGRPRPTASTVTADLLCWAAVTVALVYGYHTFTAFGPDHLRWQDMAGGAVVILAIQVFWTLWANRGRRKAAVGAA